MTFALAVRSIIRIITGTATTPLMTADQAACRARPAPVQRQATRSGFQFTFASLRGASVQGHRTYVRNRVEPIHDEYLAAGNF
jgi:hypothetical protein